MAQRDQPLLGIPSLRKHSPPCWALGTLSTVVQPPYQCPQNIPMWVIPKANVQASAGQWRQRGPAWLIIHHVLRQQQDQTPGILSVPPCHFPGSEGQRCLLSCLTPIHPVPEKPSVPPWLTAATWTGLLHADLARPPACSLPLARPTQAWPSLQVLSCELPSPTHA